MNGVTGGECIFDVMGVALSDALGILADAAGTVVDVVAHAVAYGLRQR